MHPKLPALLLFAALSLTACTSTPNANNASPRAANYRSTQPVEISDALQRVLDHDGPMRYSIKKRCECKCD